MIREKNQRLETKRGQPGIKCAIRDEGFFFRIREEKKTSQKVFDRNKRNTPGWVLPGEKKVSQPGFDSARSRPRH